MNGKIRVFHSKWPKIDSGWFHARHCHILLDLLHYLILFKHNLYPDRHEVHEEETRAEPEEFSCKVIDNSKQGV